MIKAKAHVHLLKICWILSEVLKRRFFMFSV